MEKAKWLKSTGLEGYITDKLEEVNGEISELILESERVAHSPNEVTYLMGRLAELNYMKIKLENDLNVVVS